MGPLTIGKLRRFGTAENPIYEIRSVYMMENQTKNIAVFGSTGSIGTQTLDVVRRNPDHFKITALAAKSNIDLLEKQIIEFQPKFVCVYYEKAAQALRKRVSIPVVFGHEGLKEMASREDVDFVLLAMTGTVGLFPAIEAIRNKKQIGLANKEILVSAGDLIMKLAKENNVSLLPIDSEHNAFYQCLNREDKSAIKRMILTASGGPFRNFSLQKLEEIKPEDALRHPTWSMGNKVTIDSSTLMNKGLEVIEAHHLFDIPPHQIDVVVHPQSIIHSMVEFIDGSTMAQLAEHDMRVPIQYALSYPKRFHADFPRFDPLIHSNLQFFPPDRDTFICLELAYESIKIGKSMSCYMNAANEVLVNRFLNYEISWPSIGQKLEKLMSSHNPDDMLTLDSILSVEHQARKEAVTL